MDTPVYTVQITIGGENQTTTSKIGSVLPQEINLRQSGSLIVTAVDSAGADFDLSSLTGTEAYAKPFNSSEVKANLGTGVISGAGNNIYTVSWTKDTLPAGWSTFAQDRDGTIIIWTEFEETGTADFYQWDTRVNVFDGDYEGDASTLPVLNLVFYYNPTYEYDNTTTDADPGAGKFRLNSTILASCNEMYVADDNQQGVDLQTYWQGLTIGSHLVVGNPNVKLESAYFTISGAPTNNTGYTTVPLTYVDAGTVSLTSGNIFSMNIDGAAASREFGINYNFDSNVADAAPSSGDFRLNNAAPASTTFIYFADDDKGGVNNSAYLQDLKTGDFIRFNEFSVIAAAASYTVSGTPTNATGYTKVPVTYVDSGAGSFTNGNACSFFIDSKAGDLVNDTTPQLGGILDTNSNQVRWSKGADIASAAALSPGTDGNYFDVTGTTSITSINALAVGTVIKLHFDAALTLTHHATDLILPGAANITTAAGDEAEFIEYATGDWRCINYQVAATAPGGGAGSGFPDTDNDKTTAYTVLSGDVGENIVFSGLSANVDCTLDVSLLSLGDILGVVNEDSTYSVRVVVSNTSTMTLRSIKTDEYLWQGETLLLGGDTSTNARFLSRT